MLWVTHAPDNIGDATDDETVRVFHELCVKLSRKSKECLRAAEQAERPGEGSRHAWEGLATGHGSSIYSSSQFEDQQMMSHEDGGITALPPTSDAIAGAGADYRNTELSAITAGGGDTTPSSLASWTQRIPYPYRAAEDLASSSTEDFAEEARRPLPSSRDGPSKTRLFLMSSASRRRGKAGERNYADDEGHDI